MNSRLFNRLVNAKARFDALGVSHVTVTLPVEGVLSVNWSVQEAIADTMERMATQFETQNSLTPPTVVNKL